MQPISFLKGGNDLKKDPLTEGKREIPREHLSLKLVTYHNLKKKCCLLKKTLELTNTLLAKRRDSLDENCKEQSYQCDFRQ